MPLGLKVKEIGYRNCDFCRSRKTAYARQMWTPIWVSSPDVIEWETRDAEAVDFSAASASNKT